MENVTGLKRYTEDMDCHQISKHLHVGMATFLPTPGRVGGQNGSADADKPTYDEMFSNLMAVVEERSYQQ